MVLQAKKTAVPFVGLMSAVIVIVSAFLWDFFRRSDFTLSAFGNFALMCIVVLILAVVVYANFRCNQSVQLDKEGISVERLFFSVRAGIFPRFRRVSLCWGEVDEVSLQGNVIRLRGAGRVVLVNTFYFNEADRVLQFIEQHCGSHIPR